MIDRYNLAPGTVVEILSGDKPLICTIIGQENLPYRDDNGAFEYPNYKGERGYFVSFEDGYGTISARGIKKVYLNATLV